MNAFEKAAEQTILGLMGQIISMDMSDTFAWEMTEEKLEEALGIVREVRAENQREAYRLMDGSIAAINRMTKEIER